MTFIHAFLLLATLLHCPADQSRIAASHGCDDILCLDVDSRSELCAGESSQYIIFSMDIAENFTILSNIGRITNESLTRLNVYPMQGVTIDSMEVLPGLHSFQVEHAPSTIQHAKRLTIGLAITLSTEDYESSVVIEGDLIYQAADAMRCFSPARLPITLEVEFDTNGMMVNSGTDTGVARTGS